MVLWWKCYSSWVQSHNLCMHACLDWSSPLDINFFHKAICAILRHRPTLNHDCSVIASHRWWLCVSAGASRISSDKID